MCSDGDFAGVRAAIDNGHNVNEEVKLVVFGDGHGNVVPLKSPSLVVLAY